MAERLSASPELATSLGLDKGVFAAQRSCLDDRSLAAASAAKRQARDQLAALDALDSTNLEPGDRLHVEAVRHFLALESNIGQRFAYGAAVEPRPYVVSHLTGACTSVPDMLASKHPITTGADTEAYLTRMEAFAAALDQEVERIRHDAELGVIPPDFVLARTHEQLLALRDSSPDQSPVVATFGARLREAGLPMGPLETARRIFSRTIVPALDRQAGALAALAPHATHDAGVWRLPDGEAYYAASLAGATTTHLSPETVHSMGIEAVGHLQAEADRMLRSQGFTDGSLAERIGAIYSDPRFLYPDDADGRERLIGDIEDSLAAIRARLPSVFHRLPRTPVEIRRVPPFRESGAPPAYYEDPSLDGSRAGAFYVNLGTMAAWPRWLLASTVFHETEPGHHLQQAVLLEGPPVPSIRTILWSPGYGEGWALYAEQLADELGMYDDDPIARIGYVMTTLLRACRLVADTGVNALRWSREQTIAWMTENGIPAPLAVNEVERYCVWPGQACSYMVGKSEWLKLRTRARAALGSAFDLRDFHAATLKVGAVPLTMLAEVVEGHIAIGLSRA